MNKLCRIMWSSSENCWFGWGHVGMFHAYGATPREVYTSLLNSTINGEPVWVRSDD